MASLRTLAFATWLELTENTSRYVRLLRQWRREPPEAAARRAKARLSETLLHAYRHSAWYRRQLASAGVVRNDIVRLDAFRDLPVLERDDLRRNFDDLACDDRTEGTYELNRSSGSTGEQVRFLQDRNYGDWRRAAHILAESWAGYTYGMPTVLLWGSPRDLSIGHDSLRLRVGRWLRNETWLGAFDMTSERMAAYLERIDAVKPFAIQAYADAVFELARAAKRLDVQPHRPHAVITTAVTLYPPMRHVIEQVFGPVFNHYGAREVGLVAAETEDHGGLMVIAPNNHVEILRKDGTPCEPFEVGDLVVTNLSNRAMPIIRYRIGDMASWKDPRSHAMAWPVIDQIHGRTDEVIRLRDGRLVLPESIIYLLLLVLNNDNWIDHFQVHQESFETITTSLVVAPNWPARETLPQRIEEVARAIRAATHDQCRVDVRIVDQIAKTASGKHRAVTSAVKA